MTEKKYRSKPVPGVDEWGKINKSYGGNSNKYYEANSSSDDYHGVYHTLARKYGWPHDTKNIISAAGASTSYDSKGRLVERWEKHIEQFEIVMRRTNKDDSQIYVLVTNHQTEISKDGTTSLDNVDALIVELGKETL